MGCALEVPLSTCRALEESRGRRGGDSCDYGQRAAWTILSATTYLCPCFSGGYTTGPGPLVSLLRQRARPYLFSNSLPPAIVGCASKALDMLMEDNSIVQSMAAKTERCSPWRGWERLRPALCAGPALPTGATSAHTTSPARFTGTQLGVCPSYVILSFNLFLVCFFLCLAPHLTF